MMGTVKELEITVGVPGVEHRGEDVTFTVPFSAANDKWLERLEELKDKDVRITLSEDKQTILDIEEI